MIHLIGIKAELFDADTQVGLAVALDDNGRRIRTGTVMPIEELEALGARLLSLCKIARESRNSHGKRSA